MPFQLLKIFNPLSARIYMEFTQKIKKNSTLNVYKSISGADINLLFNNKFFTFFGPLYVLKGFFFFFLSI